MFSNREKILDDLARVAGGAVSTVNGISQNIREDMRARTDEIAARLDLIPREDFERLETLVKEQDNRIKELEKQLAPKGKKPKKQGSK